MLTFSQFGSDLDASTKKIIDHGAKLTELLKQAQYQPMSMVEQVLALFSAKHGYLDELEVENVRAFEKSMLKYFKEQKPEICKEIEEKEDLSEELQETMKDAMQVALEEFKLVKGA